MTTHSASALALSLAMGHASSRLVSWAAQDGRVNDLIYHLETAGPLALKAAPNATKRRSPLHLAAIGGYTQCISVLYDAGTPSPLTLVECDSVASIAFVV